MNLIFWNALLNYQFSLMPCYCCIILLLQNKVYKSTWCIKSLEKRHFFCFVALLRAWKNHIEIFNCFNVSTADMSVTQFFSLWILQVLNCLEKYYSIFKLFRNLLFIIFLMCLLCCSRQIANKIVFANIFFFFYFNNKKA